MTVTLEQALPQLRAGMQRRLAEHLSTRPGFSTVDRLLSELVGQFPADLPAGQRSMFRARRAATRREIVGALRRLQAIGYVRYDARFGGWWR